MPINPSQFQKINVADSCAVSNILSSKLLYETAKAAGCSFCCTSFVEYECLYKSRQITDEGTEFKNRLQVAIEEHEQFKSYHLDIEDLQEVDILQKRKNLGMGELSSIALAKKINQSFMTDDTNARKLAEQVITRQFVQTTPHLLGWLFFVNLLSDGDLQPIIDEHEMCKRPLSEHFQTMYQRALEYRLKQNTCLTK